MEYENNTREILVVCENYFKEKKLKTELPRKSNCCVMSSGRKALNVLKNYSGFSYIFIPLDLEDMDYSDFIKFSKRYSPESKYILISPPALSNLEWLVFSKEIDGYIHEPMTLDNISKFVNRFKKPYKNNFFEKDFPCWRPSAYFSGTKILRT